MKKRMLGLILSAVMMIAAVPFAGAASLTNFTSYRTYGAFNDVPLNGWYVPYVRQSYELGLMNGTGNNNFEPESNITLAQAITLASRVHAKYFGKQIQEDSTAAWFVSYVTYAVQNKIADASYQARTDLDDKLCSRLVFAQMMYAALEGNDLTAINQVSNGTIPDVQSDVAVYALYNAGVLTGGESGAFLPSDSITRAEVCAITSRLVTASLRERFDWNR